MKRKTILLVSVFMLFLNVDIFAQNNEPYSEVPPAQKFDLEMKHFLSKSKKQKTTAWLLLGGGIVLNSIGSANDVDAYGNSRGYQVMSTIGGLATIGSIPLFFASSKNKNKAQLAFYGRNMALAATDSIRKIYLDDAFEYLDGKAQGNKTTAIILSAVGGAFVIAGIAVASGGSSDDFLFDRQLSAALYTSSGIVFGLLSIPFYVRAGQLHRTANGILRTGRLPGASLSQISPYINVGQYAEVGIRVHF